MTKVLMRLLAILASVVISACAQTLPDEARVPHFTGTPMQEVVVGITDHREVIRSGDKDPWFEGFRNLTLRDPFGWLFVDIIGFHDSRDIPTFPREDEQSFAYYLSTMIKESLEEAGSRVTIVELPVGIGLNEPVETLASEGKIGLLIVMRESRFDFYDFWVDTANTYQYEFELVIIDPQGLITVHKSFSGGIDEYQFSNKYTTLNDFTRIYSEFLTEILNDPEIRHALEGGIN